MRLPMSACYVNNGSLLHDTSVIITGCDTLPPFSVFWSHIHTHLKKMCTVSDGALLWCDFCIYFICHTNATPCASAGILLALLGKYRRIIQWSKWIYGLWNHSRGVMMSHQRSALALIAIKHTDRVRVSNLLTRWNMKSCHCTVRIHCTHFSESIFFFWGHKGHKISKAP